jgi:DNA-3-methyladenine glycosylase I
MASVIDRRKLKVQRHSDGKLRCAWCPDDPLYVAYHDAEWGRPVRDDRHLFEMLCLEGAQAGLSWITVLRKRDNYRRAFDDFDPRKMARYDAAKRRRLLSDAGIIRNKLKVNAFIGNAKAYMEMQASKTSFSDYLWQFTDGKVVRRRPMYLGQIAPFSELSDAMSKDLKKRGFRFVGSTICYAFMQAVGMIDEHQRNCWVAGKEVRNA